MTIAHRNSKLNTQGFVTSLRAEDHLFPFDTTEMGSSRDLLPTGGNVYRTDLDGRFGPGVGIYMASTNLFANGNFESGDLSSWSVNKDAGSAATMTLVPYGRQGANAVLCRATAYGAGGWIVYQNTSIQAVTFDTANKYTLSFLHKAYDGPFTARNVSLRRSDGTNAVLNSMAFTPTDLWQRFTTTFTPLAAGSSPILYVASTTVNAGFLMAELTLTKTPVYVPYGTNLVSGSLTYDISKLYLRDKGSVSFWLRNTPAIWNITNPTGENVYPLHLYSGVYGSVYDDTIAFAKTNGDNKTRFWSRGTTGAAAFTEDSLYAASAQSLIADRDWFHVVMQWDKAGLPSGNTKEFYLNGVLQGFGTTNAYLPQNVLQTMQVGSWDGGYGRMNSEMSDLIVSPRTFAADEVDAMYRYQTAAYDPFDVRIIL